MKKIFVLSALISTILLNSCADSTPTNNDYKQVNESFTNSGNTNSWIKKAEISNDTNYEATEEIEVSTWETATVTSFGSWEVENSWVVK